jgi:hypothetical protein
MKRFALLLLCLASALAAFGFERVVLGELVTSTA